MEPIPNSSFGSTSRSNNEDLEKWKKTGKFYFNIYWI